MEEPLIQNGEFSGKKSFTVELDAGDQLLVGVRVESGGPAVVTVSNTEGESVATKEIAGRGGMTTTAQSAGNYRITVEDAVGTVRMSRRSGRSR